MLAVIAVVCALGADAHADAKAEAAAAYGEGQKLYDAGAYEQAAERFRAAHALDPDPVYLFNTGQALRFAKRCSAAVVFYRQFLDAVPEAPNRADVESYLASCAEPPKSDPPVQQPPPPTPPPKPKPRASARIFGIAAGAVGIAAIGAGVYYTRDVGTIEDRIDALCEPPPMGTCMWTVELAAREKELLAQGKRAQAFAIAGYALGGAAVITSIVLLARKPARREPQVTLAPLAGGMFAATAFAF